MLGEKQKAGVLNRRPSLTEIASREVDPGSGWIHLRSVPSGGQALQWPLLWMAVGIGRCEEAVFGEPRSIPETKAA